MVLILILIIGGNGWSKEHCTGQTIEEDAADDEEAALEAIVCYHRLNERRKDEGAYGAAGV